MPFWTRFHFLRLVCLSIGYFYYIQNEISVFAFSLIFAIQFLKIQTPSVNTETCCHRTHSLHLMKMQTQTLRVNKVLVVHLYLGQVFEELDGHVDEELVLGDACLEAHVHLEQLVHDLVLLSLCVTLQWQHLSGFQVFFDFCLGFL